MKKTKNDKSHFMAIGLAIGIPLGVPLGLALGNIALGPLIGLLIGLAIAYFLGGWSCLYPGKASHKRKKEREIFYWTTLCFGLTILFLFIGLFFYLF